MNPITQAILVSSISLIMTASASAGHSEEQRYNNEESKNTINLRLDYLYYRVAHGLEKHSFAHTESKALNKKYHELGSINRNKDLARYVSYHDKYAHKRDFRGVW